MQILEQNYRYDLLNPGKLLDKYVGRELMLVVPSITEKERLIGVKATLLANNGGQVWKINNQIVTNPFISETRFPDVPPNLVATPTLVWDLENSGPTNRTLEASYLTTGLNWKADYVLVTSNDDTVGGLQGWVTLTNSSGLEFENARLQLVAGDVNRVRPGNEEMRPSGTVQSYSLGGSFQEKPLFEYHLYTLQRPASLHEQETKQLSLLEAPHVGISKEFVIQGQPVYFRGYNIPGEPIKESVGVFVTLKNSEQNGLGMPLPAGIIRLYKKDHDGGQQYIGEDRIHHTPKNEEVRLKVGDAFDVVAVRKQTDYKRITSEITEYAYEIVIRNHKEENVVVVVNEPIGGDWRILSSSYGAEKTSAFEAQFRVPVMKDGESKLTYRVRVKY
jgi:hypothetical protein